MENVFSKRTRNTESIKDSLDSRPEIKDLAREYLYKISKLSQVQKINLIYKNLLNSKPDHLYSTEQILNRILYRIKFGKYIKDTNDF